MKLVYGSEHPISGFCEHKQQFSIPHTSHKNALFLEVPRPGGVLSVGRRGRAHGQMDGLSPTRDPKSTSVILGPCKVVSHRRKDSVLARGWMAAGAGLAARVGSAVPRAPAGPRTDPGQRLDILNYLKPRTDLEWGQGDKKEEESP